jgi:protein-S-isoprenylcysteine O-methyltransferase Ste14
MNAERSNDDARARSRASVVQGFTHYLTHDFGGGPRPLRFRDVINFQKAGTLPFLLVLMVIYENFDARAWIYLALHGGYGIVWLIKDLSFPDPAWQGRVTLGGAAMAFLGVLGWYWVFGWLVISGTASVAYPLPEAAWFALCTLLCLVGIAIMVAADAQKYFTLKLNKGLITTGMFRYVRHPNYLGEMMIYGSFALLVWHWLPALVLAVVWCGVFAVNMRVKEESMARHPEWAVYRSRSWWLVPGIF